MAKDIEQQLSQLRRSFEALPGDERAAPLGRQMRRELEEIVGYVYAKPRPRTGELNEPGRWDAIQGEFAEWLASREDEWLWDGIQELLEQMERICGSGAAASFRHVDIDALRAELPELEAHEANDNRKAIALALAVHGRREEAVRVWKEYELPNPAEWANELVARPADPLESAPSAPVRGVKVGRNEPCPCASGRKYKKCCGR